MRAPRHGPAGGLGIPHARGACIEGEARTEMSSLMMHDGSGAIKSGLKKWRLFKYSPRNSMLLQSSE